MAGPSSSETESGQAEDLLEVGAAQVARGEPLVHERGDRHAPARAHRAEPLAVGDAHVGEVDLVEVRRARDLLDAPGLDARRLHGQEEEGEALVLGRLGIAARDQDGPVRPVRARGPDLLPVDHPVVAVALGARAEAARSEPAPGSEKSWHQTLSDGNREAYSKNATVTVYDKHRMTWDEHERFASFVTPKDTPIIDFARSVATQFKETKDESNLAAVLFDSMGVMGFTYIQNPSDPYQISLAKTATTAKTDTVDYVQYPRETLERKSGDCVDLVAFYSTALESMGITTLALEVPDHLLMMFSTGISADADGYTMNDMYVIHDGMLWIPVETTVVGKPFIKAWELGAANYYQWKDKGLTILDVHNAWNIYKPATLPNSALKTMDITSGAIEKKFPGDFISMLKISSQTKTRRYLQAIQKNPADMGAHLQMGIILAKIGDRKEAMKYFDKILSAEPKNAAALNNRGNIFMLDGKYPEAQKAYLAASQASPEDPYVWVNLAKSYKAVNDTKKAKAAFVKAQRLNPSVKEKYKAMALELLNSL